MIAVRLGRKKFILAVAVLFVLAGAGVAWKFTNTKTAGQNFGNASEKANLIRLASPRPNQTIESSLTVRGEARGAWFFEASFPVILTDWDGRIIAQSPAQAKSDWMTSDFVPFEATLTFTPDKNAHSNRGTLILKKDNPSGLPEHDDALEIPVVISWYAELAKPALNPPSWVFGPAWTVLYILMGLSLFLVWQKHSNILQNVRMLRLWKRAIALFFVQLALNAAWSIIFFGLHSPFWALIEIIVLWLAILATICAFYKISRLAAYLLLPYILWVSFAVYLNYSIWVLN